MNPFLSKQSSQDAQQDSQTTHDVLTAILVQQELCLSQVIELLKTENTAILEHDVESMNILLDKKLMQLSKLDQLDKQRQSFFEKHTGISYSHSSFSVFIKQHPSQDIQDIWQTIKCKLPECKKQNELNGKMINIRKDNTDKILQILLGRPKNTPPTYSHLGQTNLQKRSALYTAV